MPAIKQLGEADVVVGTESFVIRVGVLELGALETQLEVEGFNAAWNAVRRSDSNWFKFAKIVLARRHQDLDDYKVADIIDHWDGVSVDENRMPLKTFTKGVLEAMAWAMPVPDPNAKPATETPASTTSV